LAFAGAVQPWHLSIGLTRNVKTENMDQSWFVLVCILFSCGTRHANADDGDQKCSEIKGVIEERLNLVTHWPWRLERCHVVFTEESSGEQCCYHLEGQKNDCAKYEKRNGSRCLVEGEYNMACDGRGTQTCNFTIERVSENSAGLYRVLDADDDQSECYNVKVTGQGQVGLVKNTADTANSIVKMTLLAVLVALTMLALLVVILVRQRHNKIWMDGGTFTIEWRSCSLQLKSRAMESLEEGTELRNQARS